MKSLNLVATTIALTTGLLMPAGARQLPDAAPNMAVIKGCVDHATAEEALPQSELVWTHGDLTLRRASGVTGLPISGATRRGPFVYWLDNADDLAQHIGQSVEVTGPLSDFDEGDVTVDQVTEITLDLGRTKDTKRVPTSWLRPATSVPVNVSDYEIRVRRVDVQKVRVLGTCELTEPHNLDGSDR